MGATEHGCIHIDLSQILEASILLPTDYAWGKCVNDTLDVLV